MQIEIKSTEQLPEEMTPEYFPTFRIVGNPKDYQNDKSNTNFYIPVNKLNKLKSRLIGLSDLLFIQSIMLIGYLIGSLILLFSLIIIRLSIGPFYYVIRYLYIPRTQSNNQTINKFWNKNIFWTIFSISYCFVFWYLMSIYFFN